MAVPFLGGEQWNPTAPEQCRQGSVTGACASVQNADLGADSQCRQAHYLCLYEICGTLAFTVQTL